MKLCRTLIPTLTLLSLLAAPSAGAADTPAGPALDEPHLALFDLAVFDLAHRLAALWSPLTEGSSPPGGPSEPPGSDDDGQGGHDPNGIGDPLPAGEPPPPT